MRTFVAMLIGTATAIIGYHIHKSILWAIVDYILWPLVWIKWLLLKEVNVSIIKEAFSWFLQ